MIGVFVACWAAWQLLLDSYISNPLTPFLIISYPLPQLPSDGRQLYGKGWLDLCFLLFYVVFFSFVRQAVTEWIVRPVARWFNLRSESKTLRFMEQGYAFIYFSFFSAFCYVSRPSALQLKNTTDAIGLALPAVCDAPIANLLVSNRLVLERLSSLAHDS